MLSYFMVIIRGQNNAEFAMKFRILYIINFIIDLTPKCWTKFDETQKLYITIFLVFREIIMYLYVPHNVMASHDFVNK